MLDNGRAHTNKLAVLYDIGCHLEKGIINVISLHHRTSSQVFYLTFHLLTLLQRNQFDVINQPHRLKIGTSAFHAYAHNWGCQLQYNPRINLGWGLSDGEGMERVWWAFACLVAVFRYATKQHRLVGLNHRGVSRNTSLRDKAGMTLSLCQFHVQMHITDSIELLIQ